jgi:hypothetical protein
MMEKVFETFLGLLDHVGRKQETVNLGGEDQVFLYQPAHKSYQLIERRERPAVRQHAFNSIEALTSYLKREAAPDEGTIFVSEGGIVAVLDEHCPARERETVQVPFQFETPDGDMLAFPAWRAQLQKLRDGMSFGDLRALVGQHASRNESAAQMLAALKDVRIDEVSKFERSEDGPLGATIRTDEVGSGARKTKVPDSLKLSLRAGARSYTADIVFRLEIAKGPLFKLHVETDLVAVREQVVDQALSDVRDRLEEDAADVAAVPWLILEGQPAVVRPATH